MTTTTTEPDAPAAPATGRGRADSSWRRLLEQHFLPLVVAGYLACRFFSFVVISIVAGHQDPDGIPRGPEDGVQPGYLDMTGGWDGDCLAEDCELGVRLSTRGARVAVAYDPEVVTREETPGSLVSLFKQRTRWNQGFLQVLGYWQVPMQSRGLARWCGAFRGVSDVIVGGVS